MTVVTSVAEEAAVVMSAARAAMPKSESLATSGCTQETSEVHGPSIVESRSSTPRPNGVAGMSTASMTTRLSKTEEHSTSTDSMAPSVDLPYLIEDNKLVQAAQQLLEKCFDVAVLRKAAHNTRSDEEEDVVKQARLLLPLLDYRLSVSIDTLLQRWPPVVQLLLTGSPAAAPCTAELEEPVTASSIAIGTLHEAASRSSRLGLITDTKLGSARIAVKDYLAQTTSRVLRVHVPACGEDKTSTLQLTHADVAARLSSEAATQLILLCTSDAPAAVQQTSDATGCKSRSTVYLVFATSEAAAQVALQGRLMSADVTCDTGEASEPPSSDVWLVQRMSDDKTEDSTASKDERVAMPPVLPRCPPAVGLDLLTEAVVSPSVPTIAPAAIEAEGSIPGDIVSTETTVSTSDTITVAAKPPCPILGPCPVAAEPLPPPPVDLKLEPYLLSYRSSSSLTGSHNEAGRGRGDFACRAGPAACDGLGEWPQGCRPIADDGAAVYRPSQLASPTVLKPGCNFYAAPFIPARSGYTSAALASVTASGNGAQGAGRSSQHASARSSQRTGSNTASRLRRKACEQQGAWQSNTATAAWGNPYSNDMGSGPRATRRAGELGAMRRYVADDALYCGTQEPTRDFALAGGNQAVRGREQSYGSSSNANNEAYNTRRWGTAGGWQAMEEANDVEGGNSNNGMGSMMYGDEGFLYTSGSVLYGEYAVPGWSQGADMTNATTGDVLIDGEVHQQQQSDDVEDINEDGVGYGAAQGEPSSYYAMTSASITPPLPEPRSGVVSSSLPPEVAAGVMQTSYTGVPAATTTTTTAVSPIDGSDVPSVRASTTPRPPTPLLMPRSGDLVTPSPSSQQDEATMTKATPPSSLAREHAVTRCRHDPYNHESPVIVWETVEHDVADIHSQQQHHLVCLSHDTTHGTAVNVTTQTPSLPCTPPPLLAHKLHFHFIDPLQAAMKRCKARKANALTTATPSISSNGPHEGEDSDATGGKQSVMSSSNSLSATASVQAVTTTTTVGQGEESSDSAAAAAPAQPARAGAKSYAEAIRSRPDKANTTGVLRTTSQPLKVVCARDAAAEGAKKTRKPHDITTTTVYGTYRPRAATTVYGTYRPRAATTVMASTLTAHARVNGTKPMTNGSVVCSSSNISNTSSSNSNSRYIVARRAVVKEGK